MGSARLYGILLCALCFAVSVHGADAESDDLQAGEDSSAEDVFEESDDAVREDTAAEPSSAPQAVSRVSSRTAGRASSQAAERGPSYNANRKASAQSERAGRNGVSIFDFPLGILSPWARNEAEGAQKDWRTPLYNRFFALGFEVARRLRCEYTDPSGLVTNWAPGTVGEPTWFAGFNMRVFFGGKWGVGIEGIVLNTEKIREGVGNGYWHYGDYYEYETTVIQWLWDFDILYRYVLTPRVLVNAGAGFTLDVTSWATKDSAGNELRSGGEVGDVGYNWKIGVEYFIGNMWSITLDWKWQTFGRGGGQEKYKISSLVAGITWTI